MTTIVYTEDFSVYNGYRLVGVVATDINLNNTGAATLKATLILCLVQHVGEPGETITKLQCWVRKNIAPGDEINIAGTYFLTVTNLELILAELNSADAQTLRLRVDVTGGASEGDRTALVKQTIADVTDYSLYDARY